MRRLFIIRKDLQLHPGKLAAMVGHCAEGFWLNLLTHGSVKDNEYDTLPVSTKDYPDYWQMYRNPAVYEAAKAAHERGEKTFKYKSERPRPTVTVSVEIPKEVWDCYIKDIFTKTIWFHRRCLQDRFDTRIHRRERCWSLPCWNLVQTAS